MTQIDHERWGTTSEGGTVELFRMHNSKGTEAAITNYGGRIVSLQTPDRNGRFADIVLGFEKLDGYLAKNPYFGALVGRFGNRIANGQFTLDNAHYQLARNNGNNALHGGLRGFDKVVWEAEVIPANDGHSLRLTYVSKDGEEGYPGTLNTVVTYTLTEGDSIEIAYKATADAATIVNLTNHSYFDLSGELGGNIVSHEVTINADAFIPTDAQNIPTGEIRPVDGTPFDLRRRTPIGAHVDADDEQIRHGIGYDHTFVLGGESGTMRTAARVFEPKSGRALDVLTTQPGVQFYTGNHLDGSVSGKGATYGFRSGFCLETQHYPDSPNQPHFPSTRLDAGQEYNQKTIFRFSVAG